MESLQTSGILWFKDLTLADPYFLLPLLATGSILAILQVGKNFLLNETKYRKTPLELPWATTSNLSIGKKNGKPH
jgi:membrane protein insertase Oxa1/YidC/SpoIIIJ